MDKAFRHMQHLRGWARQWLFPLYQQLHSAAEPQLLATLSQAHGSLASGGYTADERQALRYALALWDYLIHRRFHPEDMISARLMYSEAQRVLAVPPCGPVSDLLQAHQLISLHSVFLGRENADMPTVAEIEGWLARIPEGYRSQNLWFHLSTIGYAMSYVPFLELAYQELISEKTGWLDDRMWLRVNLMYLIVTGRVARLDVLETIRRYEHEMHIRDMRSLFMDRLERLGIMDDGLLQVLADKEAELKQQRHRAPRHSRRMEVLHSSAPA